MRSERSTELVDDRGKKYGDAVENWMGITMHWAPILKPWWRRIREMRPVPPHVAALMMSLLKINRLRETFGEDTYDDLHVYAEFAEEWQRNGVDIEEWTVVEPERVYVAGPYTIDREAGLKRANSVGELIMRRGHLAHVPHKATWKWDHFELDHIMELDYSIIREWATVLFFDEWGIENIGPSDGAQKELVKANFYGVKVWRQTNDITECKG